MAFDLMRRSCNRQLQLYLDFRRNCLGDGERSCERQAALYEEALQLQINAIPQPNR